MTLEIPQPIVDQVSKARASLLLGAGASCEADFPTPQHLSKYLAKEAGSSYEILAERPLDAVVQHLYFQSGYGKQWVRQKIVEYFEKKHNEVQRPPSPAHEAMTNIRWRTIFTTNYDRLVEIAYDLSPKRIQRLLPIYAPDPQILRSEPDVIRLIKLNGSVDELARNSSHELVLTFAEQQDARRRNRAFYDLLSEEAINGLMIFVGFRFVHPGASMPGTSPEFSQLQELLRDMGPAARWHYCVSPFESSSLEAKLALDILRANQIEVINATFGDFIDALTDRLRTLATPLLKRPAVVVPIAQTSSEIKDVDAANSLMNMLMERFYEEPLEFVSSEVIAQKLGRSWGKIEPLVDRLEYQGLVTRSGQDSIQITLRGLDTMRPPGRFTAPDRLHDFTGRSAQITECEDFFEAQDYMAIVGLTGMPGIGKTSLAIELAHRMKDAFQDGVIWIPLGSENIDEVMNSIAVQFDISGTVDVRSQLKKSHLRSFLAGKHALLIFDDAQDSKVLRQLLELKGRCGVLITSRWKFSSDKAKWISLGSFSSEECLSLFKKDCEREDLSAEETGLVEEVFDLVGYHPLAVSIWACNIRDAEISIREAYDRLRRAKLDALKSISDDSLERNIREVFRSSHLEPNEEKVLKALSLCEGTFDVKAIEAIASTTRTNAVLDRLVARSLARREPYERYGLHPLLKRYAEEKIENGRYSERLADYFFDVSQEGALSERDRGNVVLAVEYYASQNRWERVKDLVKTLDEWMDVRGFGASSVKILELAIKASEESADEAVSAHFTYRLGAVKQEQQHYEDATGLLNRSLDIKRKIGDKTEFSSIYRTLGIISYEKGDHEEARHLFDLALREAQSENDKTEEARTLGNIGLLDASETRYVEAEENYRKCLEAFRTLREERLEARALDNLARIYFETGHYERVKECVKDGFTIARRIGDRKIIASCSYWLGLLALKQAKARPARRLLERALALSSNAVDQTGRVQALLALARMDRHSGEIEEALTKSEEALETSTGIEFPWGMAMALREKAKLAKEDKKYDEARSLCQESLELNERLDDRLGIAGCYSELGAIAIAEGNTKEAKKYHQKSLKIREEIGNRPGIAEDYWHLAKVYDIEGDYEEAIQLLSQSAEISRELGLWCERDVEDLLESVKKKRSA